MKALRSQHGFSLVEVTLALGIVSFTLLAVVGLLPVGLKSIKSATEQAAAANTLTSLAEGLRHAQTTNGSEYGFLFAGETIRFTPGSAPPGVTTWTNLDLGGSSNAGSRRIAARMEILETPASDGSAPGRASVSVAWSANTGLGFDESNRRWSNADGQMVSGVQFFVGKNP